MAHIQRFARSAQARTCHALTTAAAALALCYFGTSMQSGRSPH